MVANPTEVRRQIFGTCSTHCSLGLLESISDIPLDINYNLFRATLNSAQRAKKDFQNFAGLEFRESFLRSAKNFRSQGVLRAGHFQLSARTRTKLREAQRLVLLDSAQAISVKNDPFYVFALVVEASLFLEQEGAPTGNMLDSLLNSVEKDLARLQPIALNTYKELFGRAPRVHYFGFSQNLRTMGTASFSDQRKALKILTSQLIDSYVYNRKKTYTDDIDVLIEEVIKSIDRGAGVAINFSVLREYMDLERGFTASEVPAVDLDTRYLRAHGALIVGYKYLNSGEVLFLVKDSQSSKFYDEGYIHMSQAFFEASVFAVAIIELPSPQ